jgi:glycosyltransferase involved in cell wall biosynthesis
MANRTKHQLSVIVASYNEEKNIAGTIKRIAKAVPEARYFH